MDADDLEPIKEKSKRRNLEIMSIDALNEYINDLNMEIDRAQKEIRIKTQARKGADEVFK